MKKTLTTIAIALLTVSLALPATGAFADETATTQATTATVGIEGGTLTLDKASDIDFGTGHKLSLLAQDYTAQNDIAAVVTDLTGSGAGWNLTVTQDGAFTNEKGATLAGAEISLPAGTVSSKSNGAAGATNVARLAPNAAVDVVDNSAALKNADEYTATIAGADTHLTIPAGAITNSGTYTTSLTWNVVAGPNDSAK
ncbi:WxL domain-containing protein [Periweissella cryptocerci]|uniref:WxL domain-containing protein n=1 Tax=Periweissella cryptocerci TaxID=2506420 RepID=A0A4P6YTL1_9LACO|nr:WxL domain-containing protein [Periweissella cryptocerci]QBO36094.1 WxL domain-containing protein [Periweissella cryptocerci]